MSAPRLSLAYPRLWRPNTVPTFPVTLDKSHPLARGLSISVVPGSSRGAVDFVSGLAPVVTGAGSVAAGARGPGYVTNTTGVLGYAQAVAPPVFSMEVLVQAGTPGTRNEFICGWDSAAGGSGGLNDRSITGFGAGVTGSFEGYIFPGSSVTVVGGTTFFAGLISHVVLTSDGTTLALYVNGVSVASTAAGNAYAGYSNPSYFVVGGTDRTGWWWSGTIQLVNLATVAWTAGEIAARYAEPFAIFRPVVRRQYFVGGAGGGSNYTATIADTLATSDVLSAILAAGSTLADTVASGDAFAGVLHAVTSLADSLASSDASNAVLAASSAVSDSASTSDSLSASLGATSNLSDALTSSDTSGASAALVDTFATSAATSDSLTSVAHITATLSDTLTSSDLFSTGSNYVSTLADTLATSDGFTSQMSLTAALSDSLGIADGVSAIGAFKGVMTDVIAGSDGLQATTHLLAAITDTLVSSDSFTIPGGNLIADVITISDQLGSTGHFFAHMSDQLTISDAFIVPIAPHGGPRVIVSLQSNRRISGGPADRIIGS